MKRDMDLVRAILQQIERRQPHSSSPRVVLVQDRSREELYEHLQIMEDAGLVEGLEIYPKWVFCERMTWEGHEFLEQSRDEGIWEQAKDKALTQTGSLSMLAVKTALAAIIKAAITGG